MQYKELTMKLTHPVFPIIPSTNDLVLSNDLFILYFQKLFLIKKKCLNSLTPEPAQPIIAALVEFLDHKNQEFKTAGIQIGNVSKLIQGLKFLIQKIFFYEKYPDESEFVAGLTWCLAFLDSSLLNKTHPHLKQFLLEYKEIQSKLDYSAVQKQIDFSQQKHIKLPPELSVAAKLLIQYIWDTNNLKDHESHAKHSQQILDLYALIKLKSTHIKESKPLPTLPAYTSSSASSSASHSSSVSKSNVKELTRRLSEKSKYFTPKDIKNTSSIGSNLFKQRRQTLGNIPLTPLTLPQAPGTPLQHLTLTRVNPVNQRRKPTNKAMSQTKSLMFMW